MDPSPKSLSPRFLFPFNTVLLLFVLILLVIPLTINAQHYFARTYSVSDGLPSTFVNDIEQDSSGMMWFATQRGMCQYDGINWTTFNTSSGLENNSFASINRDIHGQLWSISMQPKLSIYRFTGKDWQYFPTGQGPVLTSTLTGFEVLYENSKPVFLIATFDSGLHIWKTGQWKQFSGTNRLPGRHINKLIQKNGSVFIASEQGLTIIRNDFVDNRFCAPGFFPSKEVLGLGFKPDANKTLNRENLWLFGKNWIGFLVNKEFHLIQKYPINYDNQQFLLSFMYPDEQGMYFGNHLSFYYYSERTNKITHLGRKNGLISEGASAVFTDRENNTWVAGRRGITCIPSTRFVNYNNNDGLYDNEVSSGLELKPGLFVFGHDAAISFFDGTRFEIIKLSTPNPFGFQENRVIDMDKDKSGNLWIAAGKRGLAKVSPNREIAWFSESEGLPGRVLSVAVDNRNRVFASSSIGLFIYNNDKFVRAVPDSIPLNDVRKIFPLSGNHLFLATFSQGLLEFTNNKLTRYDSSDNKHIYNIYSFLADRNNQFWIGTADGLYTIKGKSLTKYNHNNFFIDRPVYMILEDNKGSFWFGTDDGVYCWNGEVSRHYSVKDGLSGQEINRDAGFVDHDNFIWLGTNNGLTRFNQDFQSDLSKIPPPLLFLENLYTGKKTFPLTADIELPYDQNNLEFSFKGISFIDEKRVAYSCKLESYDQNWSAELPFSTRTYRISNLPPGKYRFCVKVKNALGSWSMPVCSPTIRIRYPFYFQWWFIVIVLSVAVFFGYIVFKYVVYRKYNTRLEETVSIRTSELQKSELLLKQSNQAKDRFFSIIAHDLRSPFNALLGYLDLLTDKNFEFTDVEREKILVKLKVSSIRTMSLLENLLAWARTQKGDIPMNPGRLNLTEVVQENIMLAESAAAAKNIRIYFQSSDIQWVFADQNMINTVVRNLISNAIKFTFPGGRVDIAFEVQEDEIIVKVSDTGCGIPQANLTKLFSIEDHLATKGTNKEPGTGLGLILCKEFIGLNKGKLWVTSEEGKGSNFYFTLPIQKGKTGKQQFVELTSLEK